MILLLILRTFMATISADASDLHAESTAACAVIPPLTRVSAKCLESTPAAAASPCAAFLVSPSLSVLSISLSNATLSVPSMIIVAMVTPGHSSHTHTHTRTHTHVSLPPFWFPPLSRIPFHSIPFHCEDALMDGQGHGDTAAAALRRTDLSLWTPDEHYDLSTSEPPCMDAMHERVSA